MTVPLSRLAMGNISGPKCHRVAGGTPPIDAHRYWQVEIISNNGAGSGTTKLSSLKLAEVRHGPDVLTGATITASSTWSGFPTSNLTDGDRNTFWHSNAPLPHTLTIDLGAGNAKAVMEVRIAQGQSDATNAPKDYKLKYSDVGPTGPWTDHIVVTGRTADTDTWVHPYPEIDDAAGIPDTLTGYLFHRVKVSSVFSGGTGASTSRLEMRPSIGGANIALYTDLAWATASSNWGGFPPQLAIDGNDATFWSSNGFSGIGEWIAVELPYRSPVAEIAWRDRGDALVNQNVKTGVVEGSNDNLTWNTEITIPTQTDWTVGEVRTFS